MNIQAPTHFPWHRCAGAGLLAASMACAQAVPLEEVDVPQVEADCKALLAQPAVRHALHLVRVQLLAQGLQLRTNGCPYVRTAPGQMQQVLDVTVRVVDSEVAGTVVRGPLADGEEVDMGGILLHLPPVVEALSVGPAPEDVAPDVLFNRAWLAGIMRDRGFQPLPGAWWGFLPAHKAQGL